MHRRHLVLILLISLCSGCAGTVSGTGDSGEVLVFAVSEDTAFNIIRFSLQPIAMEGTIQRVESPNKGYSGLVKLGLDKDKITAVMIPAQGRNSRGEVLDGYRFDVVHKGTAAMARVPAAHDVMTNIIRNATTNSEPLTLVE